MALNLDDELRLQAIEKRMTTIEDHLDAMDLEAIDYETKHDAFAKKQRHRMGWMRQQLEALRLEIAAVRSGSNPPPSPPQVPPHGQSLG